MVATGWQGRTGPSRRGSDAGGEAVSNGGSFDIHVAWSALVDNGGPARPLLAMRSWPEQIATDIGPAPQPVGLPEAAYSQVSEAACGGIDIVVFPADAATPGRRDPDRVREQVGEVGDVDASVGIDGTGSVPRRG